MAVAFVLGNGVSRLEVALADLKTHGTTYGCNAIYREFVPDVLVAVDRPISAAIQNSGYSLEHKMFTRRPIEALGAFQVPHPYYGYSSGPIAAALAALDHNREIYLIGFDMGPTNNQKFNNVYADTEFYKKSSAVPTYTGNWVKQLVEVCKNFPKCNFYRVFGKTTASIAAFDTVKNMKTVSMEDFQKLLNT